MQVTHDQNIVTLNNISFSYDQNKILRNIDLEVHKGDYLAIIGPNGGGKTTLLKIILGLIKPESGTVKLSVRKIGYVPQKVTNFDPNFPVTVEQVVEMGRYGVKGLFRPINSQDREKVRDALNQVDMIKFKDRLIGELSGGQQQRVFIARALATEPEIIFLDEPTVGVDTETRTQFFKLLKKLNDQLELTLVLITHDMDIIVHHGVSEVVYINKEALFYGKPEDLLKTKYIDEHYKEHL